MVDPRLAMCPTCRQTGRFEFLGEQHWPPEIARKLGLPAVIRLWSCPTCRTTLSEPELLAPVAQVGSTPSNPTPGSEGRF
jgi:hypothetical protein